MNSRELKFRSWDGQIMSYDVTLWINPIHKTAIAWDCMRDCKIEGLEIMQYTGLKDKNGKEVYEGDILYNVDNFGCVTGWGGGEQDDKPNKKIIVWDENDSRFKLDFCNPAYHGRGVSGYSLCKANCDNKFEVIGNIYENQTL